MQLPSFQRRPAVIIGTGPSLANQVQDIKKAQRNHGAVLFGVNNTYTDFDLDVWIACDPAWHAHYGRVEGQFLKYHWDKDICHRYDYWHIPGTFAKGLSTDPSYIHYNHCSGAQALNLAVHMNCGPIYLAGHDMHYDGQQRHYFDGLSDQPGEYPAPLRKHSSFDGLIENYRDIASQADLPPIYNATPGSALTFFEFKNLPT